jgi:uncharacterized protein (DUF1330 family)
MPKGYFFVEIDITDPFVEIEITDPAAYGINRVKVPDVISAHGGRMLVYGGDPRLFDGVMSQRRFIIVEFDSPGAAKEFHDSGAYRAVMPFRLNASHGFVYLLNGLEHDMGISCSDWITTLIPRSRE